MEASELLVSVESMNSGFVYLSEQASILQKARYSICETPIHFINRVLGESTVTSKEVIESITGILVSQTQGDIPLTSFLAEV